MYIETKTDQNFGLISMTGMLGALRAPTMQLCSVESTTIIVPHSIKASWKLYESFQESFGILQEGYMEDS